MHQTILMYADIHKRAKVGDVGYRPLQHHARQQVVHGFYALSKGRGFKLRARIAARFFQLFDDVGDRRHAELFVGEIHRFQVTQRAAVAHQVFQRLPGGGQDTLDNWIGFRVNGRGIQRVIAVIDAQEARALLKCFWPQTAHLQQLLAVLELTVLITPGDDILRHHTGQARHAGQQGNGSGVQVHADGVNTVFHYRIQLARQLRLAHVVLILAHADGFRVNLHQLRQRILQTTGDRDRTAQGNVQIRELLRCQLRGGVDRCPRFADDHFLRRHFRELLLHVEIETFGFAGRRTVTDGNQLNVVLLAQRGDDDSRFRCLTGVRVNGVGGNQLAGAVNHGHLHAGTQTRIETHGGAQASWRRHQQVVQVTGEDVDRFVFGALAHGAHQLGFEVHQHLDAPGPAHHAFAPAVRRGVVQAQAQMVDNDLLAVALFWRLVKLWIGIQGELQHAFVTAAEHRQRAVRRRGRNGFVVIEVVAEFRAFFLFAGHHGGDDMRVLPQVITHFGQQRRVFGEALHQNIARAVQRSFGVRYAFIGVDKFGGFGFRIVRRLVPQQIGQWLKAGFDRNLPARAALRFVRQIEVFELGFTQGTVNGFFQVTGQLALLADRFEDRLTSVFQLAQIAQTGLKVTQLRVIQTAGDFFTITCNKRHGVPFIKQANGSFYLFGSGLKFTRNNAAERLFHHGQFILWIENQGDSYTG